MEAFLNKTPKHKWPQEVTFVGMLGAKIVGRVTWSLKEWIERLGPPYMKNRYPRPVEQRMEVVGWLIAEDSEAETLGEFHDVITDMLDGLTPETTPKTITLVPYRRRTPTLQGWPKYNSPLQHILELLDTEYGDAEGEWEQDDKDVAVMATAEKKFIEAVCARYHPWGCEPIPGESETVNCQEWIAEFQPQWIKQDRPAEPCTHTGQDQGSDAPKR